LQEYSGCNSLYGIAYYQGDYENNGLKEYWITRIFSNILVIESNIGLREYSLSNACYQGDYKNVALWGCYGQ